MKKLLDLGGEALDVNGYMQDRKKRTPAMLAAESGDMISLKLLFSSGARVQPAYLAGDTGLHYAVQYVHVQALEFSVEQDGASEVLRKDGRNLQKLAIDFVGGPQCEVFSDVIAKAMLTATEQGHGTRFAVASIRPTNVGGQVMKPPQGMRETKWDAILADLLKCLDNASIVPGFPAPGRMQGATLPLSWPPRQRRQG